MRNSLLAGIDALGASATSVRFGLSSNVEQEEAGVRLYYGLLANLFSSLRQPGDEQDWLTLGNALGEVAASTSGDLAADSTLFSAIAYYVGGYSASAMIAMRSLPLEHLTTEAHRTCYDLIARPSQTQSPAVARMVAALREGRTGDIDEIRSELREQAESALLTGPDLWVAASSAAGLSDAFASRSIRQVLTDAANIDWDPLVESFMTREPPVWDFFPSQVHAISAGILTSDRTYTLQMPTGAGKTALTEALMFAHLSSHERDVAVLLVPYRALARELRQGLARRLLDYGYATRTVFGGTVPRPDEVADLDEIRAIIATPEAFSGLLASEQDLLDRIRLVVVDEGHLLDQPGRGVGLELLLARMKTRRDTSGRTVFLSAIVPNMAEINAWLGGSDNTTVRSTFRPTQLDFGVLRSTGSGSSLRVNLQIESAGQRSSYSVAPLLSRPDFRYRNESSGRRRTYPFGSFKTQAVAAARKATTFGVAAVYSPNKSGNQGVEGMAEELIAQLDVDLPLPRPRVTAAAVPVVDYLSREYGTEWVGTRALAAGAVLHHGDVPQETREAFEELIVDSEVDLVFCNKTLAEGVNLPIRTLVLYSVKRSTRAGDQVADLSRDIQNLVGRAGRPGATVGGLIICANPNQWRLVRPVATGEPGEDLHGFLRQLLRTLRRALASNGLPLTNEGLEGTFELHSLVDGVDTALIELIHEELGAERMSVEADRLARETLAWRTGEAADRALLQRVVSLRTERLAGLHGAGRLRWAVETGVRPRLIDTVIDDLEPLVADWEDVDDPADTQILTALMGWLLEQPEFVNAVVNAYRVQVPPPADELAALVSVWLSGATVEASAEAVGLDVSAFLRIHSGVLGYALPTLVDQAVAALAASADAGNANISPALAQLPDALRFGSANPTVRSLMAAGVRHRQAAVSLCAAEEMRGSGSLLMNPAESAAELIEDSERWSSELGEFVYERTRTDLQRALR